MKLVLALVVSLVSTLAFAEDFDGTWKVPDSQKTNPGSCKKGDQKECLRLAWTTEAGIRPPGVDGVKRLEMARDYHAKACEVAKKTPCANAERVQKKIDAAKALKTDAERGQFWCGDAIEGAGRFAADSKTAPVIVSSACKPLFPAKFQKALGALGGMDADIKQPILLVAAQEELCPTLKTKPVACTKSKNPDKLSPEMRGKMIGMIFKAALTGDAAARADELVVWLSK
jgi:hypothetical protein